MLGVTKTMSKTYRPSVFAIFSYGVLLLLSVFWWVWGRSLAGSNSFWGFVILVTFAMINLPYCFACVTIDEAGITQHVFRRRFVRWVDITSWKRYGCLGSDGPETITIHTRNGPVRLYHNCLYGRRLDEVESELRKRITQTTSAANGGQPIRSATNRTSSEVSSRR